MIRLFLFLLLLLPLSVTGHEPDTTDFGKCRLIGHSAFSKIQTPVLEGMKRVVSASGRFRLYYTESGTDALPVSDKNFNGINDFIDSSLVEIENIFKIEVTDQSMPLTFLDSIPVYFRNLGGGTYGQTVYTTGTTYPEQVKADYIEINSKLNSLNTTGMNMIRVTLAHEFYHVLHMQSGIWMGSTSDFLFYYEMSATFFEEVVYDSINDYRFYLRNGFYSTPSQYIHGKTSNLIYSMTIFFQYLRDRYGVKKSLDYCTSVLRNLKTRSPAVAMAQSAFSTFGRSMEDLYNDFAVSASITGTAAIGKNLMAESPFFPSFRTNNSDTLRSDSGIGLMTRVFPTGYTIKWVKHNGKTWPLAVTNGDFIRFSSEGFSIQSDTLNIYFEYGPGEGYFLDASTRLVVGLLSKSFGTYLKAGIYNPDKNQIESVPIFRFNPPTFIPDMIIGPNPVIAGSTPFINVLNVTPMKPVSVTIATIDGHVVYDQTTQPFSDRISIPVASWIAQAGTGMYLIRVESGDRKPLFSKLAVIRP